MSRMKKPLKRMTVNEETFNLILKSFPVKWFDSLEKYQYGHSDKDIVYTDGRDLIIVRRQLYVLDLLDRDAFMDNWYQIYIHKEFEQKEKIIANESGSLSVGKALSKVNSVLKKHYSQEEKEKIFKKHEKDSSTILHESIVTEQYKILQFNDCYYYDANGAYASELIKLFPKCKDEFTYMYEHRHDDNNKYKNCFNYYVGCLTINEKKKQLKMEMGLNIRKTFPKTRHYIVDNISKKLLKLTKNLGDHRTIYANTDGVVVQHPQNVIEHSNEMGEFKIEFKGNILTYQDKNYSIIQYGDEIKGNLPLELRKYVDLREGKVVHYDKILGEHGEFNYVNVNVEILDKEKNFKIYG